MSTPSPSYQQLASREDFKTLVQQGLKPKALRDLFPGHGSEATYKRARKFVLGEPHRADMAAVRHGQGDVPQPEPVAKPAPAPKPELTETQTKTSDTWDISLPRTRICTEAELVEKYQIDTDLWQIYLFEVKVWELGAKGPDGNIITETLHSTRARMRLRPAIADAKAELQRIIAESRSQIVPPPPVFHLRPAKGVLYVPSIYDHHFGKLCWGAETLGGDYDLGIAKDLYFEAVHALIAKAQLYPIDSLLFVVGNDLLHTDNLQGTTTGGTPQDRDGRYQKVFTETRLVITHALRILREVAPVQVLTIPGNHDFLSTFCIGEALACTFDADPHVSIDNGPQSRKYREYGLNLLGFQHGNKRRLRDLPLEMASDVPQMWGRTHWREIHTGDKHHEQYDEYQGVKVRIIPSLCTADAWHSQNGWTHSTRSAVGFIYDREEGLVGTTSHNVLPDTGKRKVTLN